MTKELLDQAYQLCKKLEQLCWKTSIDQNESLYNRCKEVERKSWNRYERRFTKYRSST
jgi:hypothetical protein